MPKYRVTVVTERWEAGDQLDSHHGPIATQDGCSTVNVEVEAPDPASAKAEAEKRSGHRASGEPMLIE